MEKQILSIPLSSMIQWFKSTCGNYLVSILLFTLFTKLLLFPVTLWTQRDSLKMVALLTILQQLVLNTVMRPEKYVDYGDLRKSQKELSEIDSLSVGVSKEDKRREKEDYKRFFSIANKHLVFYSEKSGFYKYFQDVIKYLLGHSNITVHYITSDPKDQIFQIVQTQPKIKLYYIGERKLIILMMKMDADMVVMTMLDLDNFHIKRSYVWKDIDYGNRRTHLPL